MALYWMSDRGFYMIGKNGLTRIDEPHDAPQMPIPRDGGLWFVGDSKSIDWSQVQVYEGVIDPIYYASMDGSTPSWVCKCCFASNPGDADKCKSCWSSKPA
jgi:hypothetical protein